MRRFVRAAAALCVAAAAGLGVTVPAAGQETGEEDVELAAVFLDAYGWWSKAQQNPIGGQNPNTPVPTTCRSTDVNACPAGPPADGIYIVYDYEAAAPTVVTGPISNLPQPGLPQQPPSSPAPNVATPQALGPTAYGAVRFIVPDGAETELRIPILSRNTSQPGGTDPTVGKLFACISTTPGWAAIQNGRYDQGPKYDCTTADEADVTGDTAVFELGTMFVQSSTLDVVIVGAGERPFQMALGPPDESSLTVTNESELAPSSEAFADDFAFEDPLTTFEQSFGDLGVDPGFSGDLGFSSGDAGAFSPSVPVARPQTARRAVPAGIVSNPFAPDASRGERLLAVALLAALGAGLWWVGGQPVRAPRLLGSLGAGVPVDDTPVTRGGIGRFARARDGRAPRLF
ncbi:MAG TPA: hypothetical protein VM345_15580 [Acidimicrobiales bacterium]|nr:hypothetical protein [Acidimicrobiales bacterium]